MERYSVVRMRNVDNAPGYRPSGLSLLVSYARMYCACNVQLHSEESASVPERTTMDIDTGEMERQQLFNREGNTSASVPERTSMDIHAREME